MLLSALLLASAASPVAPAPVPTPDHGKLAWVDGTFEALVEKAEAQGKIIFLDFWADW